MGTRVCTALLIIAGAVASSCGDRATNSSKVETQRPSSSAGQDAIGFTELSPAPTAPARFQQVASGDGYVAVFGGYTSEGGTTHFLADGAFYRPEADKWAPIPEWPFDDGAFSPGVAIVGGDLIVVGQPCGDQTVQDESQTDCGRSGLQAAGLDLATGAWSVIDLPPAVIPQGKNYMVAGLGAAASAAYFSVGTADALVTLEFHTENAIWRQVPDAPGAPDPDAPQHGPALGAAATCGIGTGFVSAYPDEATMSVRTWSWDNGIGTWKEVASAGLPKGATYDQLVCGEGALAYLSYAQDGLLDPLLWFDTHTLTWVELPRPSAWPFDARLAIGEREGQRLLWPGGQANDPNVYLLPADGEAWQALPSPLPGPVTVVATDEGILAIPTPDDAHVPRLVAVGICSAPC